jgi:hypothetical protein
VRGNPHAAFDVAGAGNVAWSRWCDTRRRKGEKTGNTNFDLNRRASPRPYCAADGGEPFNRRLLRPDTEEAIEQRKATSGGGRGGKGLTQGETADQRPWFGRRAE